MRLVLRGAAAERTARLPAEERQGGSPSGGTRTRGGGTDLRRLRPSPRSLVGLAVSGGLLWWAFRGADLASIAHRLRTADPTLLVATAFLSTSGGLIRALRWRLLLEPAGAGTTLRSRWAALNIGFMVTNLFPARLGEIARPLALSRMAPVSMSQALGTVVLERILDAVAIVILTVATLLSPAFPTGAVVLGRPVGHIVLVASLVACAALGLAALAAVRPEGFTRVGGAWLRRLPGRWGEAAAHRLEAVFSGLLLMRRPGAILRALLWSLLLWAWMGAAFWTAFRAFDIHLGFTAAMFTECALSLFEALPAAPGFIGTMQAGVLASVHGVFGVATGPTLSMAVGYYVAGFIPVTLLGLYYASAIGLRLRTVGRTVRATRETASAG